MRPGYQMRRPRTKGRDQSAGWALPSPRIMMIVVPERQACVALHALGAQGIIARGRRRREANVLCGLQGMALGKEKSRALVGFNMITVTYPDLALFGDRCHACPLRKERAMPRTSPYHIELTKDERDRLQASVRRYTSAYRDVTRAKIVLLAAEGMANDEIAARLGTPRQIVSK